VELRGERPKRKYCATAGMTGERPRPLKAPCRARRSNELKSKSTTWGLEPKWTRIDYAVMMTMMMRMMLIGR